MPGLGARLDGSLQFTSVGADWSYDYDARGNLDGRYEGSTPTHDYTFDVEGRLASVRTNNQTTTFFYDADGQRVMTSRPDGVVVYTPFPDYEREIAVGGAVTERTTYSIAGQMVAVRSAGTLYYTYGDHLGSVVAMSNTAGGLISGSLARYDPFGNYRTWPGSNVNPLILDRGFTGHVHDNTGPYPTQNVGLIYMNARYYLPEVGRFVSADTIVPEPGNPQSYNRYSYSFNNPINYTDPSGYDPLDSAWEEAFCNEHFGGMSGCVITDDDRRDRLFSVIFCGSGANCTWTAKDWAFYSLNKGKLWAGTLPWTHDVDQGLDRFLSHLDRLASYYNPGEEAAFVKAVGNVWGGILFGPPGMSAIRALDGPSLTPLHEGNDNWIPELVESRQDATHHYAGLFYAGYFFGVGPAHMANLFRDGPRSGNNPPDLHLGYVAAWQGGMLSGGWGNISLSQLSTAARFALDVRLNTWYEPTRFQDYLYYWYTPYSER